MARFEAWHRHLRKWTIPLALCLVNLAGVVIYRTNFAGSVETLQREVERERETLVALEARRRESEEFLASVERRREAMATLYDQQFATAAERFTTVVNEAKKLARDAGLQPLSLNYPNTKLDEWDLRQRRIIFPVQGSYDQLRMFINFLELTDQFLTLERISLNEKVLRDDPIITAPEPE